MQGGRSLGHLVREAISNVFDVPEATKCDIWIKPGCVIVEDNAPLGIKDKNLITTVFLTDKEEKHTTRGRKGLGLKELISAGHHAEVETANHTLVFHADGTRTDTPNTRQIGTKVTVWCDEWIEDKLTTCIDYLKRFMPPNNVLMTINGQAIKPSKLRESFSADLRTTIVRNNKQVEERRTTKVDIRNLRKGEKKGWVYEMGIPVQEIETKFNIDIQQRIPMNDNRDVCNYGYMYSVYGAILDSMIKTLSKAALKDRWVLEGLHYCTTTTQRVYASKFFPTGAILKCKDKKANDIVEQHGFDLVDISHLPSDAQGVIHNYVKSAEAVAIEIDKGIETVDCPQLREQYPDTVRILEWLAKEIIGVTHTISFMCRDRRYNGYLKMGDYTSKTRTVRFNIKAGLPLDRPLSPQMLAIFIHELGHFATGEHDQQFHDTVEMYSGIMGNVLFNKHDEVITLTSPHAAAKAATSKSLILIHCQREGCKATRLIHPQDKFQVKYCVECQKIATRERAKERRRLKREEEDGY